MNCPGGISMAIYISYSLAGKQFIGGWFNWRIVGRSSIPNPLDSPKLVSPPYLSFLFILFLMIGEEVSCCCLIFLIHDSFLTIILFLVTLHLM